MRRKSRLRRNYRKPSYIPDKQAAPGLAKRVFLNLRGNRNVMTFSEAVSWAEYKSKFWFGRKMTYEELLELYRVGRSHITAN